MAAWRMCAHDCHIRHLARWAAPPPAPSSAPCRCRPASGAPSQGPSAAGSCEHNKHAPTAYRPCMHAPGTAPWAPTPAAGKQTCAARASMLAHAAAVAHPLPCMSRSQGSAHKGNKAVSVFMEWVEERHSSPAAALSKHGLRVQPHGGQCGAMHRGDLGAHAIHQSSVDVLEVLALPVLRQLLLRHLRGRATPGRPVQAASLMRYLMEPSREPSSCPHIAGRAATCEPQVLGAGLRCILSALTGWGRLGRAPARAARRSARRSWPRRCSRPPSCSPWTPA